MTRRGFLPALRKKLICWPCFLLFFENTDNIRSKKASCFASLWLNINYLCSWIWTSHSKSYLLGIAKLDYNNTLYVELYMKNYSSVTDNVKNGPFLNYGYLARYLPWFAKPSEEIFNRTNAIKLEYWIFKTSLLAHSRPPCLRYSKGQL